MINSVRKFDVERKEFMERPCDSLAGFKQHLTYRLLAFLKKSVMDMCRREKLHQVELLTPPKKITDREYCAQHRKQETAGCPGQISADSAQKLSVFQTQKQFLRDAIEDAASYARTAIEFEKILFEKYGVLLKENRGRFSYLHPNRSKFITDRSLGTLYKTDSILKQIAENAEVPDIIRSKEQGNACSVESRPFEQDNPVYETSLPNAEEKPERGTNISEYNAERNKKTPDTSGQTNRNAENKSWMVNSTHKRPRYPVQTRYPDR